MPLTVGSTSILLVTVIIQGKFSVSVFSVPTKAMLHSQKLTPRFFGPYKVERFYAPATVKLKCTNGKSMLWVFLIRPCPLKLQVPSSRTAIEMPSILQELNVFLFDLWFDSTIMLETWAGAAASNPWRGLEGPSSVTCPAAAPCSPRTRQTSHHSPGRPAPPPAPAHGRSPPRPHTRR